MSRAFVKESDGDLPGGDQPELPQSPHPNYITPAGLAALKAQLAELAASLERLLATDGDALESKLSRVDIERQIRYLEGRIERAIPTDPGSQSHDRVCFGARVEAVDETGTRHAFAIVGEDESDAVHGKVSWVSPLARALLGGRIGDVVTWRRPAGDLELEILTIDYPDHRAGDD